MIAPDVSPGYAQQKGNRARLLLPGTNPRSRTNFVAPLGCTFVYSQPPISPRRPQETHNIHCNFAFYSHEIVVN